MTRVSKLLGATALIAVGVAGGVAPAHATYVSSFSFVGEAPTVNTGSVQTGTVFDMSSTLYQVSGNGAVMGSLFNQMTPSPVAFTVTGASSGTATFASPFTLSWVANGIDWTFTATSATFTRNSNAGSYTLTLYFDGTLTDNGVYVTQSALLSDSFTQSGGGTISEGGSFTTPDPNTVPEPASMAIVGLGLAGIAAVRRRRASV
jgi:hypothetical protein